MSSAKQFGEILRRHREQRDIALRTVADETKIGLGFLTALESGDCSKWPGGIYSRAWIRAYATAIGLDPDDIGGRFARCFAASAFPEGDPQAIPSAAELPRLAPLRLTLEPDPAERLHTLTRRAVFYVIDLILVALTATAVSLFTVVTFWTAFAVAASVCHGIGLFGGGGSTAGWVDRAVRRHARPHEHAGDPAVEAA